MSPCPLISPGVPIPTFIPHSPNYFFVVPPVTHTGRLPQNTRKPFLTLQSLIEPEFKMVYLQFINKLYIGVTLLQSR